MLHDSYQRRMIIARCWSGYDLIADTFAVPHQFHIEFPSLVELALCSGYFQILVEIGWGGHFLHIHEEYAFPDYTLVVKAYSYNLLDKGKHPVIRADPLPHHQVDYRGHELTHFPYHLHDETGKICSFSGQIESFIKKVVAVLDRGI